MKKFLVSIFIFCMILSQLAIAFTIDDDADYKIEGLISEGGDVLSGGDYIATVVLGQPAIGYETNSNYIVCLGALCTYIFEPEYSVRLSGNLRYDDNSIVSKGDVWLAVEYMGTSFIGGKTKTDSSGNFNSRVTIPEFIYNKDFDIKIYASGQIDAVYECTYDQSTNECS